MSEQKLMSDEEKLKLRYLQSEAISNGDEKEAMRLRMLIPLDPKLANSVKRIYGLQYLIEGGFNLSEAEAIYGKEWFLK